MDSIHVHDVVITSLSNPHHDLPNDTEMIVQLIINESIFLQTVPVKKNTTQQSWGLKVDCKIPTDALSFSIAIICVSVSGGTRLLGKAAANRGDILAVVEQKQSFSLDLDKMNDDGPSLKLDADFSVSLATHVAFHPSDAIEDQISSLGNQMILPQLNEIYDSAQGNAMSIDSLELFMIHERILLLPQTDEKKSKFLNALGDIYYMHYQTSQHINHLHQAICLYDDAMRGGIDNDLRKAAYLNDLGISLSGRFERLGDLDDMNRAVLTFEHAVQLIPDGQSNKPCLVNNLGKSLLNRFKRLGELGDIDKAVLMNEHAVQFTPDDDIEKPLRLDNLGNALSSRFQRLGDLGDINKSVSISELAVQLTPDGHPDKPSRLSNFGSSLLSRFGRLGNLEDLNKSVLMKETAVQLTPDGHPDKPAWLNNLGSSLTCRFERLGDLDDLNKAIVMFEYAVQFTPDGHPTKPLWLSNLGSSLSNRFQRLGDLGDMNKSVLMKEQAVELTPDGHPDKPLRMSNFGSSLLSRFERLGDLVDINKSIFIFEHAVQLTPDGHPSKPSWLTNLGSSLLSRFKRLGDLGDLNKAVFMNEHAVQLTPDDHPSKPSRLNNFGSSLLNRFQRLGNPADANKSVQMFEHSVQLTSDGHPDKPTRLNNLGQSFFRRFQKFGNLDDMNNSIVMFEHAVQLTPDGHISKPSRLSDLGSSLTHRFDKLGDLDDMNKSISMFEHAVQLTPDHHPDKPSWLYNLGNSLLCRLNTFHDYNDLDAAISYFCLSAFSDLGSISVKFQSASMWAKCAHQSLNHSVLDAYTKALQLLPQLAWLGLSISDRHHHLLEAGAVVRDAVAAAIEAKQYTTAIEWLEQGRSIVWGQLLQLRNPVDDLHDKHPTLANHLKYLSRLLEGPGPSTHSEFLVPSINDEQLLEGSGTQYHDLAYEREELLKKIRTLSGFDTFLLPKKFSQLVSAACGGPVIAINISEIRCDALILLPDLDDDVLHISLPKFTYQDAKQLQQSLYIILKQQGVLQEHDRYGKVVSRSSTIPENEFESILSQLWLGIVRPILDGLSIMTPPTDNLIHVWWSLTGPLAFLPIHAAGLYGASNSSPGSKLADYVVSSYTPTLTALIDGHHCKAAKPSLLAVALPLESGLPCVIEEIGTLEKHAQGLNFLKLMESNATIENVVMGLQKSNWVHFACHGVQEISDPTKSALLLTKGACLTLLDMSKLSLPHAEFAYLSACQTATGVEHLSEEAVHLTAGMLSAGFHGVIGTMWSIKDNDAPKVADDVYAYLLKEEKPDPTQAAFALHEAVKKLCNQSGGEKSFFSWVPYIHVGV